MVMVVHLQDKLTDLGLLRLYRSADVYVSPHRSEGFGLSTLEAIAMGLQACHTLICSAALRTSDVNSGALFAVSAYLCLIVHYLVQVLITDSGPSREICPAELCTFIEAAPALCLVKPCGDGKIFGMNATHTPQWSEPSQHHLQILMKRMHLNSQNSNRGLGTANVQHARSFAWYRAGTDVLQAIEWLLNAHTHDAQV